MVVACGVVAEVVVVVVVVGALVVDGTGGAVVGGQEDPEHLTTPFVQLLKIKQGKIVKYFVGRAVAHPTDSNHKLFKTTRYKP